MLEIKIVSGFFSYFNSKTIRYSDCTCWTQMVRFCFAPVQAFFAPTNVQYARRNVGRPHFHTHVKWPPFCTILTKTETHGQSSVSHSFVKFYKNRLFILYISIQWCISQTQQNFIMFIIVLGQHVSILIESSSGPSKKTDPRLKCFKMRCGVPKAYFFDKTMYKMHVSFCSYCTYF